MAFSISVLICTHNPRRVYFERVIDALRHQSLAVDSWELLVIDNRSDTPLEGELGLKWHPAARLAREERLGLTAARLRAIGESRGDLLVFVDDDNVLDDDYLEAVLHVAAEKPFLGSWSGQCRPEFEVDPPEWTRRYWGNLVIREFEKDVWSNLPRLPDTMPCGAGLVVRRDVAEEYLRLHEAGVRQTQFDRAGGSLLSGGDNDLAACACDLGYGMGIVSNLKLTHLIPKERFTVEYLTELAEGIHYSSTLLDAERGIVGHPRAFAGRIVDMLREFRLKQPHRRILRAAHRGRNRALIELAARKGCAKHH